MQWPSIDWEYFNRRWHNFVAATTTDDRRQLLLFHMFELNHRNRNMSNAYLYSVYASSRDSCSFASFCFRTFFLFCFAIFRWKNLTHLLLSSRLTNPNQIHSIHFLLLLLAREFIEMMMMIACAYISYTSVSDINIYFWMGCRLNDTFVCDLFCEWENSLMNTIQNAEYTEMTANGQSDEMIFLPI